MSLTRRQILQTAIVLGVLGTRSWAATEAEYDGFTVLTLSDGHLELPRAAALPEGVPQDALDDLPEVIHSPLNVTLLKRGDDLILFDAGSGPDFMPTAGELIDALAALDIDPGDITHVIFTHAHPDHIWGVLDDFDEPAFFNARHLIARAERDFWTAPDILDQLPEDRHSFAIGAQRRLEEISEVLDFFDDGDEVLPGITARATPGHTPGHSSFVIEDQVMVLGDVATNAHVSLSHPELGAATDHDPEQAAETRKAVLEDLAESGMEVVGYHFPDGGLGHIERDGDGYRFIPKQ
ncbi:MAG: MBL fold metallo-hydrolase [Paracoccus sp. (in: a-proteobacteria)]|nr:MBL fold metallo-hydrolase [Paracoccus sp. (in: a-proteobacteria)]